MCIGQNRTVLYPDDYESKLGSIPQGSAVKFIRSLVDHVGIYLGTSLSPDGQGVPLLWHFYGPADDMAIRVDDFREIVQGSKMIVYNCGCSAGKRSGVIEKCLDRIGERDYDIETKNCEHVVHEVITGQSTSPQVNLYCLFAGLFGSSSSSGLSSFSSSSRAAFSSSSSSVLSRSSSSSTSGDVWPLAMSGLSSSSLASVGSSATFSSSSSTGGSPAELNSRHMAIVTPTMDVLTFGPSTGEWTKNGHCTQIFTGTGASSVQQALSYCQACWLFCCRPCKLRHHQNCTTGLSTNDTRCCGCSCTKVLDSHVILAIVFGIIACLLILLMKQLF